MNDIRREEMRKYIEERGVVSIKELNERFSEVSGMTVHRDLGYLENEGYIARVRGGAKYRGGVREAAWRYREVENPEGKRIIAQKSLGLISEGSTIYVDSGTTSMALMRILPDMQLRIMTNGPSVALEAVKRGGVEVSICGGSLNRVNLTLSGQGAVDAITHFNVETAFITASGYSPKSGFCCGNERECEVKRAAMEKARRVIMLIDSAKNGRILPHTICGFEGLDCIVTDKALPEDMMKLAEQFGVKVI